MAWFNGESTSIGAKSHSSAHVATLRHSSTFEPSAA